MANLVPPPYSVDWLWWHPDIPHDNLVMGGRLWHCWNCDVTWKQYYEPKSGVRIRCWCCGQFQKLPKI